LLSSSSPSPLSSDHETETSTNLPTTNLLTTNLPTTNLSIADIPIASVGDVIVYKFPPTESWKMAKVCAIYDNEFHIIDAQVGTKKSTLKRCSNTFLRKMLIKNQFPNLLFILI
jgi:hypothetical protein